MRNIFFICLFGLLSIPAHAVKILENQLPFIHYLSLPIQSAGQDLTLSGEFRLPRDPEVEQFPAVIVLHSSGGVDSTGRLYIKALNNAGIATFELDMWGARGLSGGTADRPATVQETLADAFAALEFLAQREDIDADRIGVLGFSWGGVLSLLTATEAYNAISGTDVRFAGHVAHYPVCWAYNVLPGFEFSNLTGSPVMIQSGELDDYDVPGICEGMVAGLAASDQELVDLKMYENAYHAWDRLEPALVVEDPFAHLGQGGIVNLVPDQKLAKKSRKRVVRFFKTLFDLD
ncbi:prolyl oligopeptidase family serine peptidase [Pseudomaricurvus alkylphenolicus]|jgi:dienelactone hydrolase|uniref:dienelactone hydrolase family protein n=1 Tax=Pseudomaricurvus alkylphenolicus TaxID=1306991 RepID=UPI00141E1F23|nr:dienelactone hydrolase family protein [Pseudomaricurvus alkylphenolicus]NIB41099.1 prolyl oligopeptidase family serine peptidase [Pseudomaricurvus alkylphenolicus]